MHLGVSSRQETPRFSLVFQSGFGTLYLSSLMINKLLKHKKIAIGLCLPMALIFAFIARNSLNVKRAETTRVERKDITKYVNASGETEVSSKDTKYAQVTAQIEAIKAVSGQTVSAGDTIIVLDAASLRATYEKASSDYSLAKATVLQNYTDTLAAQRDEKAKKLIRDHAQETYNGDTSPENKESLRTAETNYQTAFSNLETLKAKKEGVNKGLYYYGAVINSSWQNLNNTNIKAPASGMLAIGDIKEGQQVTAGSKLFQIVTGKNLEFLAEVDESDISQIKIGQSAEVNLNSNKNKKYKGVVKEVGLVTKTTSSGATAIDVKIELIDFEDTPIVGLSGDATIKTETKKNSLVIPTEYLQENEGGLFVNVLENGRVKKLTIEVGLESSEGYEVISGLNEGDIIVKGSNFKEGEKVKK